MTTLGIDLSSMPPGTAACAITWGKRRAMAGPPHLACDDARLDALIADADVVGIDAPLGWPAPFAAAVGEWTLSEWNETIRDGLMLRETDRDIARRTKTRPLSVSSDRIALPAMRAMALLRRHGGTDRSGDGRFFEVYPAGSLAAWGLTPAQSYKHATAESRAARRALLAELRRRLPWLEVADDYAENTDALDALLAALSARAAAQGLSGRPRTTAQAERARSEGWIHVAERWPTL